MTMKACAACPHQKDCQNLGDCLDHINARQLAKTHGQFPRLMTPEQANLFMERLRGGETIRRLTGGGKLGKAVASKAKYQNHCLDYPGWGAEAERLAKKNQNAAFVVTTTINWAKARQRSADSRRNSKTCANGHVRTLENTFYVRSRDCLARRCKDCNKIARRARMPKAEEVRVVVAGLHHGGTLTSTASPYGQTIMRNFLRQNPKIGERLRRISKKNTVEHLREVWRCKRQSASSSLTRNNGVDAYEAVRLATVQVPTEDRDDVMSRMFVAVAEGRLRLSDASLRVGEFLRAHRSRPRVLGDYSLDKLLGDGGSVTWLDTKTDADRLWT